MIGSTGRLVGGGAARTRSLASSIAALAARARPLAKEASTLLSASVFVQVASAVTGLLIVRSLPVEEYALYTLGNALFSLGAILATMSAPSAVVYLLSRPGSEQSWPTVVGEALRIGVLLIVAGAAAVCIVTWLYREQLDQWTIPVGVLGVVSCWLSSRSNLWRAVAFARREIARVARVELAVALLRLSAVAAIVVVPLVAGKSILLLATNLLALLWMVMCLRRSLCERGHDRAARKEILHFMRPLVPEHVYFVLQGQLGLFLLAYFAEATAIAELGALSRLGMLVSVLTLLNTGIFQPFVARHASRRGYLHRSVAVLAVWLVVGALGVAASYARPDLLVMIIGPRYAHLESLVPTLMLVTCLSVQGAALYTVVLASGRPAGLSLTIPVGLAVQLAYLALLGVSTVPAALGLMLASTMADLLVRAAVLLWLIRSPTLGQRGLARS